MLNKYGAPPRLQRWGQELGTFLPFLKVAYRKGAANGMADLLSRYPSFEQYVTRTTDLVEFPVDSMDFVGNVPLFTHELTPTTQYLSSSRYDLPLRFEIA